MLVDRGIVECAVCGDLRHFGAAGGQRLHDCVISERVVELLHHHELVLVPEEGALLEEQPYRILLQGLSGIEHLEIERDPSDHAENPEGILFAESLEHLHRIPDVHREDLELARPPAVNGALRGQDLMLHYADGRTAQDQEQSGIVLDIVDELLEGIREEVVLPHHVGIFIDYQDVSLVCGSPLDLLQQTVDGHAYGGFRSQDLGGQSRDVGLQGTSGRGEVHAIAALDEFLQQSGLSDTPPPVYRDHLEPVAVVACLQSI